MSKSLETQHPFVPRGAFASFGLMIVFYIVAWLAMYFLMVARG